MTQTTKQKILIEAAKQWFIDNPEGDPKSSADTLTPALFNDNDDADQIENAIVTAGHRAGYSVEPQEMVHAALSAKEALSV